MLVRSSSDRVYNVIDHDFNFYRGPRVDGIATYEPRMDLAQISSALEHEITQADAATLSQTETHADIAEVDSINGKNGGDVFAQLVAKLTAKANKGKEQDQYQVGESLGQTEGKSESKAYS